MQSYRRTPDGLVLVHFQLFTLTSGLGETEQHQLQSSRSISVIDQQSFEKVVHAGTEREAWQMVS